MTITYLVDSSCDTEEQTKKVTYKDSLGALKWEPVSLTPTKGSKILVDLTNLSFMGCVDYIKKGGKSLVQIAKFFRKDYLTHIEDFVFARIISLRNEYEIVLLSDSAVNNKYHSTLEPKIKDLDLYDKNAPKEFVKRINNYLMHSSIDYIKYVEAQICNYNSSLLVYTDKKYYQDFTDREYYLTYSTNLDHLLFGKDAIYKQEQGIWYFKSRKNMADIIKKRPNDSLIETCFLIGTKYAKALKSTKKSSIINNLNKKESLKHMLSNDKELLDCITRLANLGF